MSSAYRQVISFAVAVAVAAGAFGSGTAVARSLKDHKPHAGVKRAHTMPVQGIDVSYWQGDIDWNRVRQAGIEFAFIKATEGGDHLDPKFRQNWYAAKRAGVARGAYHFIYWCRYASEQADWFVRNVPADPDALPPVLDLEWHPDSKTCPKKVSRELALKKIKIILDAMERHTGKRPIIYTDPRFHKDILEGQFEDYHFWLRSVAAEPHKRYPGRKWAFWQFTATGHVPGVPGKCDRNIYNGSRADWNLVLRWLEASSQQAGQVSRTASR
ncbi:glycoside hydrolase family 25 protein [Methyloceanibacter caenitepidi]|uniref:Phage lysin, glycosyl hydrolase, family 25 n=1 Tax=Methyloceanibacter caenitepidi TaxID=1384459 RepID=A0A0A8K390_9HYPH|nr:GH25 family lysozyme [Methyloceanibacter caenitepidi]BAQ17007.1 phage lysin, glycosyl hydrolase, family 25 [Methyloceanibacter caenitepidi]